MKAKFKELITRMKFTRLFSTSLVTVAFLAVTGAIYAFSGSHSHLIWIVSVIAYAATMILMLNYGAMAPITGANQSETFLGSLTLDLMIKMPQPVMICNADGKIVWYNSALADRLGRRNVTGISFDDFIGKSLSEIKTGDSENGTRMTLDDRTYYVRAFSVSSKNKKYLLTLWEDTTSIEALEKQLADEETQVAYILADNLEELSQYTKDGVRNASNEIDKILKEWAEGANGILKEYQSSKYVFIFRAAEMADFVEKKFEVLDRIREVRVGESSFSVTVSMGVSDVEGTLYEKEKVASDALDMALQRGGDQVVVKSAKGLEFYGGKSQSVQKRTKVRSRVIANELASQISRSSRVIIMGHRMPDFDCIGASVGIARLCAFCGVPFNIVADVNNENFRKCYERIINQLEYRDGNVFVNSSEAQDLIASDTLTVIVDVNNKTQLEAPEVVAISSRVVYIDHHRKTAEFDEAPLISYIEPSASSASELVAEILEQSMPSGNLTKDEADIMYSGILLDTKQFTRNAGVRTFGAALYLRGEGASPSDALTLFKSALSDFISEAKFESNVVVYRKMMAISVNDSPTNTASDRISAAKAADKLLTVEGVKASFALCRIDDSIHISARSSGEINVQLILEKIQGGGHFDSAATKLTGSMNEALSMLKNAIDEYLTESKIA
ncbi:MAG: DHH family phosphoesterase [Clostridia bacterium]|nr:DHH family phosphoesterase [Clostridia bacterium]